MTRIALFTVYLIAFAIGLNGFSAYAQRVGKDPSEPVDNAERLQCVTDATITVTANPSSIQLGQSSVLHWAVDLPDGCIGVQVRLNGEVVARNGSRTVSPPRNAEFVVGVSEKRLNPYAEKRRSVHLAVSYPERVVIDSSSRDPVQLLIGALVDSTNYNQVVILSCDVDIDLTGHSLIIGRDRGPDQAVGQGLSLIASPDCARSPSRRGPRIFVTDKKRDPLFDIRGSNVLLSGFRLEGPTSGIGTDNTEDGITINPFEVNPFSGLPDPIHNIEISNMEIYHWSGSGITVLDNSTKAERGRLFNTNVDAVRINGNYIHHNRHGSGFGYGVAVGKGAYALIEQNVFDENRHAITGGLSDEAKRDFPGYTARDNLILPGGGLHCATAWYGIFACFWQCNCLHTQQIDVHGIGNRWYSSNNWQCGTAGETIIIERNTILYDAGLAINVRGNPADKAVVSGNIFKKRSGAIAQNGACGWGDNITNPIIIEPNNVFGSDPSTELGSCDFFGYGEQGKKDRFMATGVTWWAKSPITEQWRYLNTMPERLAQIQLKDVDGDGKCDVAERQSHPEMPPRKYSKGGTGPWQFLQAKQ